jgi:hypothetical protein
MRPPRRSNLKPNLKVEFKKRYFEKIINTILFNNEIEKSLYVDYANYFHKTEEWIREMDEVKQLKEEFIMDLSKRLKKKGRYPVWDPSKL